MDIITRLFLKIGTALAQAFKKKAEEKYPAYHILRHWGDDSDVVYNKALHDASMTINFEL